MSAIKVFRCPSCGASISTDGEEAQIVCQFCGTTVIVPEELRSKRPQPPRQARAPQVYVSTAQAPAAPRAAAASRGRGRWVLFLGLVVLACIVVSTVIPLVAGLGSFAVGVAPAVTALGQLSTVSVAAAGTTAPSPTPGYAELALSFGGEGTGAGKFDDPRAIGVDGQGNVYVGEYTLARIQKFDSEGQFITSWIAESGNTSAPLRALAADRAGNVYAVRGGDMLKYAGETGELLATFEDEIGFDDVAVLPNGGLLACACFGGDDLVFLDADGAQVNRITDAVTSLTGDSVSNLHVAVDGVGNIFVLSQKHKAVFEYDASGRFVDRFGSDGDEPGQFTSVGDIAVDSRSRVYVSDFPGVQVFTTDGQYIDVFDGPQGYYLGLAFTAQDVLYAASNSNEVFKFTLNGQ